jgi:tRNA U34 2-thiouridine synthase MnmA/TrmU
LRRGSRVTWWREGEDRQNAGDFLASLIRNELFLPLGLEGSSTYLIGSVIDDRFLEDASEAHPAIFWGAGCRDASGISPALRSRARILAVRGPLTRAALGLGTDVPMGDAAFLLPGLVEVAPAARTAGCTVVVPHVNDERGDDALLAASGADVVVRMDIPASHAALLSVIAELAAADLVLSASLHGALVALAWGRPFAFWDDGAVDLPFKWQDAAALLGIETTFHRHVADGRAWHAAIRDTITVPSPLPMLAHAPLLVRPDALIRVLRAELRRPGADTDRVLDDAATVFRGQRALVDAIAEDAGALGEASRVEQRLDRLLAGLTGVAVAVGADMRRLDRDPLLTALRAEAAHEKQVAEREREEAARAREEAERAREDAARGWADAAQARADVERARADQQATVAATRAIDPRLAMVRRGVTGATLRARHRVGIAWTTPLLDPDWYRRRYPDVVRSGMDASAHFRRHGSAEQRSPNEHLDPKWYLERYPDVAAAKLDPVDHYLFHGAAEGRDPGPGFDTDWYLAHNPDVVVAGINPLVHWLRHGRAEGRPTKGPSEPETASDAEPPAAPPGASSPPSADAGPRPDAAPAAYATYATPAATVGPPWPSSPPAPFVPPGAHLLRRDPALVDRPIVVGAPRMERESGTIRVTCAIGDGRELWIRVAAPDAILDRLVPRIEPFIPGVLMIAAEEGRPVRIEPPLDPGYEHHLRLTLIPLMGANLADADIVVERTVDPAAGAPPAPLATAGLLFSGGVDSLYSLHRMREDGWPPDALISVDAGANDTDLVCRDRRREGIRAVADELGIPLVTVDTNLHLVAWLPHQDLHVARNLGTASVLQAAVGTLVYSATQRLEATSFAETKLRTRGERIEILTAEAVRWGGMELLVLGDDLGRTDKTAAIMDDPIAWRALDVCTDQTYQATRAEDAAVNCSRCDKCARTILLLEHLGVLDRFAARFDLDAFGSVREAQVQRLREAWGLLDREVRDALAAPRGTLPVHRRGQLPDDPIEGDPRQPVDATWGYGMPHGATPPRRATDGDRSPLTLDAVTLERSEGRVRLTCPIDADRAFWIEVAGPPWVLDPILPRLEPFIPPTLLLALAEDRTVRIDRPLDPTYARRLVHRAIPTMSSLIADHDVPVDLRVDARAAPPPPGDRIALMYSGGVDSMYSLHRMEREGWPPDLLLSVNAGANDLDRTCWGRRVERAGALADELGIPLVTIDTNLHELGWVSHAPAHMFRNPPAASVLQPVVGSIVYSSSHRIEATSFREMKLQAQLLVEPMVLDTMRWGGMELVLLGNDVRRMDKLAGLPDMRHAGRYLDLCTDQSYQASAPPDAPVNCGRCFKCARTLLLLEHLGSVDRFAHRFDLAAFETVRDEAARTVWTGTSHSVADARWLLSAPRGTVPRFRRGWTPPDAPPEIDGPPWPASPPAPFVPAGARLARRDPALVDRPIVVGAPRMEREAGATRFACPIGDGRELWIRVAAPEAILDRLLPRVEPFIGAILVIAAQEGRPVRIEPALDPGYERQLRLRLIPLVSAFVADADLVVSRTVDPAAAPPPPGDAVALPFSGGVDSLHALQRMRADGWPPDLLLHIDAGAGDTDLDCRDRRRERVRWVADQLDVPLVTIDSNLHQLAWVQHTHVHAFRNLGAASVLQPIVGTIVYSPGHRFELTSFPLAHQKRSDFMEPVTFGAMRWGGLEIHPLGNDRGKAYKVAGLIDDPIARGALDVCVDQEYQSRAPADAPANRGRCTKCARTLLVIEHLAALDRFASRFDLAAFATVRDAQIARLQTSDHHLDNEARLVLAGPSRTLPPLVRGTLPPGPGDARAPAPVDPPPATASEHPSPLRVGAIAIERATGRTRLICPVGDGREIEIVAEGPDELVGALDARAEPFVPLALLLGVLEGRPVAVDAPLHVDHARRMRYAMAPMLSALLGRPDIATTWATGTVPAPRAPTGRTALLFSAGVDSFRALTRMRREGWAPDLLVNLDAGAHDLDRQCWRRRLERVHGVAAELGIPVVAVSTNLRDLHWADHALVHAVRNLATASVLEPVVDTLVYSSGHRLEATDLASGLALGQDLVEPVTVDLPRWGGLEIALLGNDVRRIDKVAGLVDERLAWRFLDVCVDQPYQGSSPAGSPTNCGRCQKCARVILTLEHLDALDRFAACFDLAAFERDRERLMTVLMTRDHPIDDEFRELLRSPRGTLPPFVRGSLSPRSAALPV